MKKLIIPILFALLVTASAVAQCNNAFYSLKEGQEIEMTTYNKKDKPEARIVYVIDQVVESGDTYEATFNSSIYDKKDELVSGGEFVVVCEDGNIKVDMQGLTSTLDQLSAYDEMEVESEVSFLEIPSSLEVGQSLPDGHTAIKVKMGESNMAMTNMQIDVVNRKVEAKESINTPAGTFECFKITYDTDINMKMMGFSNTSTFSSAEWVARGVGVVRSESYDKKGRLNSYSLLTAYK